MSYNNLSPNHSWKRVIFILVVLINGYWTETGLNGAMWTVSIYMVHSDSLGIDSSCYCRIVLIDGYWTKTGLNGAIWTMKICMVDFNLLGINSSCYCCIVMIDVILKLSIEVLHIFVSLYTLVNFSKV